MENTIKEVTIDLDRVRKALPDRAVVSIAKTDKGSIYIRIVVSNPSLYDGTKQSEEDIEMIKDWLRDIIGKDNILEIDAESEGTPWNIYLKRNILTFINL